MNEYCIRIFARIKRSKYSLYLLEEGRKYSTCFFRNNTLPVNGAHQAGLFMLVQASEKHDGAYAYHDEYGSEVTNRCTMPNSEPGCVPGLETLIVTSSPEKP